MQFVVCAIAASTSTPANIIVKNFIIKIALVNRRTPHSQHRIEAHYLFDIFIWYPTNVMNVSYKNLSRIFHNFPIAVLLLYLAHSLAVSKVLKITTRYFDVQVINISKEIFIKDGEKTIQMIQKTTYQHIRWEAFDLIRLDCCFV